MDGANDHLDKLAQPKGRTRLMELHDAALGKLDELHRLLALDGGRTSRYLVRGSIMEMESACYRLESALDKLRDALR